MSLRRVCIAAKPGEIGGPSSFIRKLTVGLEKRNISVTYSLTDRPYDVVLVINATRELGALWRCKRAGIPIVQRLGGMNWAHHHLPVGWRGFALAEVRNLMMRFVRVRLANAIVYQSRFVEDWWNSKYGSANVPSTVIYNGVDLEHFSPEGERYEPSARVCMLVVEGSLGADPWYIPVQTAQYLISLGVNAQVIMFGQPRFGVEAKLSQYPFVTLGGAVPNGSLPPFYRGASVFVSTDVIAACPNSVIEALSCGTPVVGFRAGVLPEMLEPLHNWCVEYDGDPWRMEAPRGIKRLGATILELARTRKEAGAQARQLAEQRYSLEHMVDAYCRVLFD